MASERLVKLTCDVCRKQEYVAFDDGSPMVVDPTATDTWFAVKPPGQRSPAYSPHDVCSAKCLLALATTYLWEKQPAEKTGKGE